LAEVSLFLLPPRIEAVALLLFTFFIGFKLMEAILPSLVSKMAPVASKGTAMGLYSSSQFLGAFVGGAAGGWLLGGYETNGVFAGCALMTLLWLLVAAGMQPLKDAISR